MKKRTLLMLISAMMFVTGGVVSCGEKTDDMDKINTLTVTPSEKIQFNAAANQDITLTVSTDAKEWTCDSPGWVVATKSGKTLVVNVKDNTTSGLRTGKLTFAAGNAKEVVIDISQELPVEEDPNVLSVEPAEEIVFKHTGNTNVVLTITTDAEAWSYENPEWVIATKSGNKLTLNVTDNATTGPLSGEVTIAAGTATPVTIAVSQQVAPEPVVVAGKLTDKAGKNFRTYNFISTELSVAAKLNFKLEAEAEGDAGIEVFVDADYLAEYNTANGTQYKLFPQNLITIADNGAVTIADGTTASGDIALTFDTSDASLELDQLYLVPLCVRTTSENISVTDAAKRVNYVMCKNWKVTKNVVFFEVNDVNPLNALEYQLADGRNFIDAVVIFSANINYKAEEDVVYLNNNKNVQALLDETEVYIQPLRKAGIKVYLSILGNHDAAGVAQLSDWGAQQFGRELALAVEEYKLDGITFDDEYSKSPILSNKWFAPASNAAAARLCYETKKAMAELVPWETEVGVFYYNNMRNFTSVDGQDPGEFIDFMAPNYGGFLSPLAGMTKRHCADSSIELNLGKGNATEQSGKRARTGGYGWYMWFSFNPVSKRADAMGKFNTVSRGMYEQQLKNPTGLYKKISEGVFDPVRYDI